MKGRTAPVPGSGSHREGQAPPTHPGGRKPRDTQGWGHSGSHRGRTWASPDLGVPGVGVTARGPGHHLTSGSQGRGSPWEDLGHHSTSGSQGWGFCGGHCGRTRASPDLRSQGQGSPREDPGHHPTSGSQGRGAAKDTQPRLDSGLGSLRCGSRSPPRAHTRRHPQLHGAHGGYGQAPGWRGGGGSPHPSATLRLSSACNRRWRGRALGPGPWHPREHCAASPCRASCFCASPELRWRRALLPGEHTEHPPEGHPPARSRLK